MSAERDRLGGAARPRAVAALGAVPQRARLGHRARGLQRRRRRVELLPARPRPLARLPLERGRARRHLRRPADALLRARVLERPRPDPEGAHLRPHRPRGQPRRGRQGVLVVPRLDADALVDALALHVPAGRVPLRAARRRERARAASTTRSSSCVDTGVFDDGRYWEITADYAKAAPEDMLHPRLASATPGPSAATIDVLPTLWFRNTWSWGDDAAKPHDPARRTARSSPSTTTSARTRASRRRRSPRRCSATTRRTPRGSGAPSRRPPYPKDGIGDHVVHGAATVNPERDRHEGARSATGSRSPPGETADDRAAPRPSSRGRRRRTSTRLMARARGRGRRVLRRADAGGRLRRRGARAAPGARRDAVGQAVLPLRRRCAGSRATPPARRRRTSAGTAATASGRTSTTWT